MADNYWKGGAAAVAQVTTIQITGYDAATTYKITVGAVVISTVGTGGTVNTTATALAAAWNASTHPYCTGVTALAATDTVSLTADTAGVPFVVTSSVTGGTGTIGAATAATASAGPNDWGTAANWSLGVIPANSDNVYLRNLDRFPILWGLAQSGVTPTLLVIEKGFVVMLGLFAGKFTVSEGEYDDTVPEYRQAYLAIGAATVRIGEEYGNASASGSPLVKVDTGTTNGTIIVYASGTAEDGQPAVRVKQNHASAVCSVYGGRVGHCWETPDETGQVATVNVYDGEFYGGPGLTNATIRAVGGTTVLRKIPGTLLQIEAAAQVTLAGSSGTCTTVEKRGGLTIAAGTYTFTNAKG